MKKSILKSALYIMAIVFFIGCSEQNSKKQAEMHWDRDMCDRCKMVISERKHAVQVKNVEDGKVYKFDDLGCAIKWFKENKITWEKDAMIWITDVNSGKWIDARTAYYDTLHKTPMGFGFSANETKESIIEKNSEIIDFNEVSKRILMRKMK